MSLPQDLRARLAGAFASNAFGYAVSVVVQLASVPILLAAWGAGLYGEWLLFAAVPAYLMIADVGLGSAASNEMAMAAARGERAAAAGVFRAVGLTVLALGPALLLPLGALFGILPAAGWFGLTGLVGTDYAAMIALMLAQVWLALQMQMLHAGFRAAGHYARSTVYVHLSRLGEFAALAAAALADGDPVAVTAAALIAKAVGVGAMAVLLYSRAPWLLREGRARLAELRPLLRTGLMFVLMPCGTALNQQAPLFIVGLLFGPAAVAAFSTLRLMTRAVQQLLSVLGLTVWHEISHAFAVGDHEGLRRLTRLTSAASLWIGLAGAAALAAAGPAAYRFWTHALLPFDGAVFALLLAALIVCAAWYGASILLSATNRPARVAIAGLLANLALLPLAWMFGTMAGLAGIALALLLTEFAVALWVLPAALRLAGDDWRGWLGALLAPRSVLRNLRAGARA